MKDGQSTLAPDDSLSQADIILPSQYFESVGSAGLSGEQRLMLAVLVDAINVLQSWQGGGSARKRRDFGEAAQWVNTRGTSHPFSFDSVCDFDTPAWPTCDAQIWPTTFRCIVQFPV